MRVNTRNTSGQLIAEERRRAVAALRRRRLTMRQIVEALARNGQVNPRTNKPWSLAQINKDIAFLQDAARAEAVKDVSEHRAAILADYNELLRLAWAEKRYDDVRRVLKDIRDLLGTDAPQVIVFEQMEQRMTEAVERLERAFAHDPIALQRALDALMGVSDQSTASVN